MCFCNDSISLKDKKINFFWAQEFPLHCHLWWIQSANPQSTTFPMWAVWRLYLKARVPRGRLTEEKIEKVSRKMLMLQVQVVKNCCVQPGSQQRAGVHLLGEDLKLLHHATHGHCTAAGWIPLRSPQKYDTYIDSINLIICHQLVWSMLGTNFYEIATWSSACLHTQRHVKGLCNKKFSFKFIANISISPIQCKKKKHNFSTLEKEFWVCIPTKCHENRWN